MKLREMSLWKMYSWNWRSNMLKLLVKKQLIEIFRVYFYDAKKNKARSKLSTIMFMIWFAVVMTGVLGLIFTMLSKKLCAPMAALDMGWMYYALMGFNMIFSYMKGTNVPSSSTAVSYGCRQVDEYLDEENEITKVFGITREERRNLCNI